MSTFTTLNAGWGGASPAAPSDAIIGPDGNLWAVCFTGKIYKFDTIAFTTTEYTISGASALWNLCTDGTFIYATDNQATSPPFTVVYKITTAGVGSVFFDDTGIVNGGNPYFDGTDIWVTSTDMFWQLDLTGAIINAYRGPVLPRWRTGQRRNLLVEFKWQRRGPQRQPLTGRITGNLDQHRRLAWIVISLHSHCGRPDIWRITEQRHLLDHPPWNGDRLRHRGHSIVPDGL